MASKMHVFRMNGKEIEYICNAGGQTSTKNITNDYFKVTCPECKELLIKERIKMELNKERKKDLQFLDQVMIGLVRIKQKNVNLDWARDIMTIRINELKDALSRRDD